MRSNSKAVKSFTKLFADRLTGGASNGYDALDQIIQDSELLYNRCYGSNSVKAYNIAEKSFNVDDVILGGVKEELKNQAEDVKMEMKGLEGGAELGEIIENVLEGGGLSGGQIDEQKQKDDVEDRPIVEVPEDSSDSDDIDLDANDILDIIGDGTVNETISGGKIIENVLQDDGNDRKDEPVNGPIDDIMEGASKGNPVDDIMEGGDAEKEGIKDPIEDIMEGGNDRKEVVLTSDGPVEDADAGIDLPEVDRDELDAVVQSIVEEQEQSMFKPYAELNMSDFESDYSDYSSEGDEEEFSNKYLDLIKAIRATNAARGMSGGGKNNRPAVVIDAYPWIVDDDSDSD